MILSTENIVLIGALLLFVSVFAGKLAYRFGAPALLVFLGVGMLFGVRFISFNSAPAAQFVGMVALCVILFSGGMDTRIREIRPVALPGVVLATAGVLLTALLVGGFVYLIAPHLGIEMPFLMALLIASVMASTDSASVFSILRTRRQGLCENLRPLLELESGSNDPMAYVLTVVLVGMLSPGESMGAGAAVWWFCLEMCIGLAAGYLFGRGGAWIINRLNLDNPSLYPVLLLAIVFLTFSCTEVVHGNGYLAVYLAGLVMGNRPLSHKHTMRTFFDGFTWLFQIILFVTLGLLVNLPELLDSRVLLLGGAIGLFMILVARPVAVGLCLLPFRKFSFKARLYVSWVGLRGAVPIIFATYPVVAGVGEARLLFNVVFLVTLLSLLVQGTTVSSMANLLGLAYKTPQRAFSEEVLAARMSATSELRVTGDLLAQGTRMSQVTLPSGTLVVLVRRGDDYFVPRGDTELQEGDVLLTMQNG